MNSIICGNAFESLAQLPEAAFSTIVTSPRYNIGKNYGEEVNDKTSKEFYLSEMRCAGRLLYNVAKDDCLFFLNVGDNADWPNRSWCVCSEMEQAGWNLVQPIVWLKSIEGKGHFTPTPGNKYLNNVYEHVFILSKDKSSYSLDRLAVGVPYTDKTNTTRFKHGQTTRCAGNVWYIPYETTGKTYKKCHAAPFPVELPERCIKLNGCRGPVLDPFAGVLTTALAAKKLGVDYTVIDIVPENISIGKEILDNYVC